MRLFLLPVGVILVVKMVAAVTAISRLQDITDCPFSNQKQVEMANTIKVLFWLHRSKKNADNKCPLKLRLRYQNQQVDKASGYYLEEEVWNGVKQRVKGHSNEANLVNEWIEATRNRVNILFRELSATNGVHLTTLLDQLFSKPKEEPTLLKYILDHNEKLKLRVGKDYSYSTYEKYCFTYDKLLAS